jgi:ATP-dependent Clp protease ATP-binding subunit ClpA
MVPDEHLREKLRTLPVRLREVVLGQDEAIALVAPRLQHGELGLTTPGRPKASFLFLGPTGVGKTSLAREFTTDLFGPGRVLEIDMSDYMTLDRLALLLGTSEAEPGRIAQGYEACGGRGTILFDEIEKAHPRVLDILLQLLDVGRLTVAGNRVLDFSPWYAVLTSNLGAQRIMAMRKSIYETMRRLVRQDAQRELRPELFARITEAVVFNRLDYDTQCRVAALVVGKEARQQGERGHTFAADGGVVDTVIKHGYHDRLGARPMRDAAERLVRDALTEDLLGGGRGTGRLRAHPTGTKLELRPAATAGLT